MVPGTRYFVRKAVEHTMANEDNLEDAIEAAHRFLKPYQEKHGIEDDD